MKPSLKRAHRLEREADRMAQATTIKTSTQLSIYSPELTDAPTLETTLAGLVEDNQKAVARSERLFDAAQTIRTQLLHANQANGIAELLLTQNQLSVRIKTFKALIEQITDTNGPQSADTAFATSKARRESTTSNRYGFDSDQLTVAVKTESLLGHLEQQVRRWQEESDLINEQLTAKNVNETITLTKPVIDVLVEAKIVSVPS